MAELRKYLKPLDAFLGGLGWLTRVPINHSEKRWEAFTSSGYVFPLIGGFVGGIAYLVLWLSLSLEAEIPAGFAVFGYIVAVYLIQGINHVDGLADLGDAFVIHGEKEEKLEAMKDSATGVGGLVAVIIVFIGLYAAGTTVFNNAVRFSDHLVLGVFFVAEVSAKTAMSLEICLGKPSHEGFGSKLIEETPSWHAIPAVLIGAGLVAPFGIPGFVVFGVGIVGTWVVAGIANRHIGGLSGDVFGATNESVRLVCLCAGGLLWTLS